MVSHAYRSNFAEFRVAIAGSFNFSSWTLFSQVRAIRFTGVFLKQIEGGREIKDRPEDGAILILRHRFM